MLLVVSRKQATALITHKKVEFCGAWGHGSVDKVLAVQACGPEFKCQHPCKNPGTVMPYYNPSAGEVVTGSLELTGKPHQ